jgi:hypothetical protein
MRASSGPGARLRGLVVMVMVVMMMVIRGGKSRAGKHHNEQGSGKDFLHGLNVAPSRFQRDEKHGREWDAPHREHQERN